MLALFPDEQIISQSSEGSVTLTSHRICYEYREWGRSYNQNIMLEHITSCENFYKAQVWLLIIGAIALIGGLVNGISHNDAASMSWGIVLAIVCFILYWYSRKNMIMIASPSTKMLIKVTGMRREKVLDFINKVEHAKNSRLLSMNNRTMVS